MEERFTAIPLHKNDGKKRFEIEVDGHFAFITFGEMGRQIMLVHSEAESELAGTGALVAVVEKTLVWVEENEKKLLPFCPYVFDFIKQHPEWKRVVDPKFKAYDEL